MTSPTASRPPEPAALAAVLERLAQLLLLLVAAALVPGLVPFQPLAAAWSLRISQILVEMAPVLLLALLCSLLASYVQPAARRRLAARIASVGYGLYAALVPLQVLGYGALWFASGSETQQRLEVLQNQALAVQPRMEAAASTAEQKQQVLKAIEAELQKQRTQLEQQRDQFLLNSLLATLRGVVVAAAMAWGLYVAMRFVTRQAIC